MKLTDRIEELLQTHQNPKYNELWPVCQKIVADSIQHSKQITAQMSNYDIICTHIATEEIDVTDPLFSTVLNIVITLFPSLADKIFTQLCDTALSNAPIPSHFNLETNTTIKELMKNTDFSLNNVDFRKYEEVYRRIFR